MKAAPVRWMRRAGTLVAALAVLLVTSALVRSHVEKELKRTGSQAAIAYIKAGRFPLRSKPEHENPPFGHLVDLLEQNLAREDIEAVAIAAHVPGDVGMLSGNDIDTAARDARVALPDDSHVDWLAAKHEADAAVDKAKDTWRRDHRAGILMRDVLYGSVATLTTSVEETPKVLRPLALYLSLPFKIALGLGFGIALGLWIIKRLDLRIW